MDQRSIVQYWRLSTTHHDFHKIQRRLKKYEWIYHQLNISATKSRSPCTATFVSHAESFPLLHSAMLQPTDEVRFVPAAILSTLSLSTAGFDQQRDLGVPFRLLLNPYLYTYTTE